MSTSFTPTPTLQDCLKIAKFFALAKRQKNIDLDSFRTALAFFKIPTALKKIVGGKVQFQDLWPKSPGCLTIEDRRKYACYIMDYGSAIIQLYKAEPRITVTDELAEIIEKLQDEKINPIGYRFDYHQQRDERAIRILKKIRIWPFEKGHTFEKFCKTSDGILEEILDENYSSDNTFYESATNRLLSGKTLDIPQTLEQSTEIARIRDQLTATIEEQPLAINELIKELQSRTWQLRPEAAPSVFLLLGAPISGKSLFAETLARAMPDRPCFTMDLATFQSENQGFALTGQEHGYSDAHAGKLTSFVDKNPNAIVILKNIEKAHINSQGLLIPLITDGVLVDAYGFGPGAKNGAPERTLVSFKNAIVLIETGIYPSVLERSNFQKIYNENPSELIILLREEIKTANKKGKSEKESEKSSSVIGDYLSKCCILPFRNLGIIALKNICKIKFQKEIRNKLNININDIDALSWLLVLSESPGFDASKIANLPYKIIVDSLTPIIGQAKVEKIDIIIKDENNLLGELKKYDPVILKRNLFRRSQRLEYAISVDLKNETIRIVLSSLKLVHVPVSNDFGNEGGISIEMPQLKFNDIFGHSYIKDRLQEVVHLLKQNDASKTNQISLPRGMLLYGKPGTGKTMLAKALAAEADLPFILINGPQLLVPANIKTIFRRARQYAPSLIFIDEIDALGVRGTGGNDSCINLLLTEIDGFDSHRDGNVFIMAATNFPNKVDPALTRSGRLDLRLEVPMLDRDARRHFIARLNQMLDIADFNLDSLVELSAGMTGADIEKFIREAHLDAIRCPDTKITQRDLLELMNVIRYGFRLERKNLAQKLESTAYHEAGHAVVSSILNPDVRIDQVSIVPRQNYLGITTFSAESLQQRIFNLPEVVDSICVALAGRIAENHQFPAGENGGGYDAGAESDLATATAHAWKAVAEWGLDEEFGWLSLQPWASTPERIPQRIQDQAMFRVSALLKEAREKSEKIVSENWGIIEAVAKKLLKEEALDSSTLKNLIQINK